MTRDEFGHWAAGVLAGPEAYSLKVALLLSKAREVLKIVPVAARVPSMLPMRVGEFCGHNVRAVEHCDACALSGASDGIRIYALALPVGVGHVYVRREPDEGHMVGGGGTGGADGVAAVVGAHRPAGG
jgi:hypothetical protein